MTTDDPRIVKLARETVRGRLGMKIAHTACDAALDDRLHEASRQIDILTRPEAEAFLTKLITLQELVRARIEELDANFEKMERHFSDGEPA